MERININVNPLVGLKDGEKPTLKYFAESFLNIFINIFVTPYILIAMSIFFLIPLSLEFLTFCFIKFCELILYLMEKYIIDEEGYKEWKKKLSNLIFVSYWETKLNSCS